jgi:RNA polymerase sigma-70 factor (ECF subfamily)
MEKRGLSLMADVNETGETARRAAERIARESYGRLLAYLAARTRDVVGAEDALGDALVAALRQWPEQGVPDNPDAWILTAARRRQTDALRRNRTRTTHKEHLKLMLDEMEAAAAEPDPVPDRRLALMFTCAHPAVEEGMRTPLILQTILGLTAADIASAFLIPPATMGQRLVRAKARLREAGIPFRVPDREELPQRLDAVLAAIYSVYTKAWNDSGDAATPALAEEAIWLARLIVSLLPDEPEAQGMLALMLYAEARRGARRDAAGTFVPLEAQDVALWDDAMIAEAEALLHAASSGGPSGRYQIEAAIQSAHAVRRFTGTSDWDAIVALYDSLFVLTRSPVVAINRAAAYAEIAGPEAALADIADLARDERMTSYQPYWAVRAHLAARAGDIADAEHAFTLAIGLSADTAVRDYLRAQQLKLPLN